MSQKAARKIEAVLRDEREVHRDDLEAKTGLTREQVEAGLAIANYHPSPTGHLEPIDQPPRRGVSKPRGITPAHLQPEAERRAALARTDPRVEAFRRENLDAVFGDAAAAAEWMRKSESPPPFSDALPYVLPSSQLIQYAGTTPGDVLDQLRILSAALAARFGWRTPLATLFVLTDATPPLVVKSITNVTRIADGHVDEWIRVDARADDDPRAVGDSFAAHRTVSRRQPTRDQERLAALRAFVDERDPSATWPQLFAEWNNNCDDPEWRYSSAEKMRQGYNKAAAR
jgi:hypothetical protein